MMRVNLTYECGCFLTLDLDPWCKSSDGEVGACHGHRCATGEPGHAARRPLSLTYHEEGGGD